MNSLRSITLRDCKLLAAVEGAEKLLDLQWLQITGVHPILKLPKLSSLEGLQYLEIDIRGSQVLDQLGDLSNCSRLREIYVVCPSLIEFPRLKSMKHLEKVEFSLCDKVEGPLDCTDCVNLQTVVLTFCCQMAASPLLSGCEKLSKLVLTECHAVKTCPDVDVATPLKTLELLISSKAASAPTNLEFYSELENLQLWNMRILMELPSFERLANLTVLKLGKCGIREPPDLTGCKRLQDVYFFSLVYLQRFPKFSILRELKKLSLCDCISVQDPPNIEECHKLQVFHLLYNDNMEGLPKMDKCAQLEEIQVSWRSLMDKVAYRGFDPDSCQVNEELEFCLEYWKDEKFGKIGNVRMPGELEELQCVKGKTILLKRYLRGVRLYYSLTSPYQWFQSLIANRTAECQTAPITLSCENGKVIAYGITGRECQDRDWLNKVRGYFANGEVIVKFRDEVRYDEVKYNVRGMQGEARMCEEVAIFFNKVQLKNGGVRFVGLYGIAGQGKTTLCKAFCNSKLKEFEGKVCYLEFSRDEPFERAKHALEKLIHAPLFYVQTLTDEYQAKFELHRRVKGKRVLLVLDNITEESMDEVGNYLKADFGGGSWILLSARSGKVLENDFQMDKQSCMHVPRLREDEAITILLERACPVTSTLKEEDRVSALKCAKRCLLDVVGSCDNAPRAQIFHPLALKVFGGYLLDKYCFNLPKWVAEIDDMVDRPGYCLDKVFAVLGKAFDGMPAKYRTIFMLLTDYPKPNMYLDKVIEWMAINSNESISFIEKALQDLRQKALIEEFEPEIRIHDLCIEYIKRYREASRASASRLPIGSYHGKKFDAFLSHSGEQKNFVRQLNKDLTNQGVSCFFDQDRKSLPLAEHFPSLIFEATKTCKVAVLLLSKNFLESKWPMLELSAFVQAKYTTNPNLKILPLFYNIPTDALKQITVDNEKWTEFEKSKEERAKMHEALAAVRGINGLKFSEGDDEVKFREEIVKGIWHLLPMPSPRYHVLSMQGEERMCQELAMFFRNLRPNGKGIRIAGLYGIAGQGKTTLGKAFCNFKLSEFEGRVCHLELSKGDPNGNIKLALQYLTHMPNSDVQSVTSPDQAKLELEGRVKQQRVLLVLDNLAEDCIDEVLYYLKPELGANSWVLLSARSVDVLEKHFQINKQSCMRVPRLEEEEAITILLERAFPGDSIKLGAQDREFALECAKRCLFKEVSCDNGQSFHPLAMKAFGGYLSSKYGLNLSKWVDEVDGIVGPPCDGLDDGIKGENVGN